MSDPSSPGSADSTTASTGPDTGMSSSANPTPTGGTCSPPAGPECPSTTTYALSENQRGELLLTDVAHQLTSGGGKPGQGPSSAAPPTSRRYSALGDAVTSTVAEWIGRRLMKAAA
jgi:hypothetical protein